MIVNIAVVMLMSGCGENKSNKGAGNRGKNRFSNLTKDSNKDNKSSDTDIDSNDNDTDNSDKDTDNNGTNKKVLIIWILKQIPSLLILSRNY